MPKPRLDRSTEEELPPPSQLTNRLLQCPSNRTRNAHDLRRESGRERIASDRSPYSRYRLPHLVRMEVEQQDCGPAMCDRVSFGPAVSAPALCSSSGRSKSRPFGWTTMRRTGFGIAHPSERRRRFAGPEAGRESVEHLPVLKESVFRAASFRTSRPTSPSSATSVRPTFCRPDTCWRTTTSSDFRPEERHDILEKQSCWFVIGSYDLVEIPPCFVIELWSVLVV